MQNLCWVGVKSLCARRRWKIKSDTIGFEIAGIKPYPRARLTSDIRSTSPPCPSQQLPPSSTKTPLPLLLPATKYTASGGILAWRYAIEYVLNRSVSAYPWHHTLRCHPAGSSTVSTALICSPMKSVCYSVISEWWIRSVAYPCESDM